MEVGGIRKLYDLIGEGPHNIQMEIIRLESDMFLIKITHNENVYKIEKCDDGDY